MERDMDLRGKLKAEGKRGESEERAEDGKRDPKAET